MEKFITQNPSPEIRFPIPSNSLFRLSMKHCLPASIAGGFNSYGAESTNTNWYARSSWLGMMVCFVVCLAVSSAYAQNVNVNPGAGSYPTLKAAFDAINSGTHTGAITIDIVNSTSESATAELNASGVMASSYTSILIQPSGGASRTITGSIAGPLINLNGADNVTIDGLNTGGNSLTISNTSTGLASAIQFIGDASNNTIQNDTIRGSSASAAGAVILFSTGTTTGNDGNNVNHCSITAAGTNLPVNGIMSTGTSTSIDNSGNTINLNNIYDYFSPTSAAQGINLTFSGGSSAWTITNNRLYQTANRITTSAGITHSGIFIGTGSGYTITGNIIGFANAAGTGTTNMAGISSGALGGTFPSSYTLGTAVLANTRYVALNCAFTTAGTVSEIQNNTIGGFALLTSSGASTSNGIWCGINVVSGNANIGTTTGNTIGATSGSGSVYTACSTTGGTAVGIYATTTNSVSIQNNSIGAFDAVGTTATTTGGFTGIDGAGTAGVVSITNNNIGNASVDNIRTGYTLLSGSLSNAGALTSSTGATSAIVGVRSSSTGTPLTITGNTLRGWATSGTVTAVTGISSTGAVTSTVNLNSNLLGTASLDWIRYAVANSGTLTGINCTGATAATTISIQSNNIRGITYSVAGTGVNTYINITGATATNVIATIASNLFTNLTVNTTGTVTLISHNYAIPSTGQLILNNNSIVTAFNRGGATGSLVLTASNSTSGTGSINNYTNNNFSNITVTGTTTIIGFNNTDGGAGSTKTITGNTFNSWTGGTGTINTMNFSYWNGVSSLSNNTITNITNQGTLTGVTLGSSANNATSVAIANNTISNLSSTGTGGTVIGISCSNTSTAINISNNTITGLSSTGSTSTVSGISIGGATTTNIFKNKIADLSGSQAGSIVNGINITSGATINISNNLIGNLTAPAATGLNAINGINANASSTFNVYYNTIYLNASSSSATTFGNSCMTFSSTATAFNSRNNLLVNMSTPAQEGSNLGANGIAACLRRSAGTNGTVPANYSTLSNNNLYWVNPTLGTNNHLTYVEGTTSITNPFNTLALFKAFLLNRDQASVTESVSTAPGIFFQNFTASSTGFLHLVAGITTQAESGAANIATYTDDFDADVRQGNGGYSGSGTAPDIGADEFAGVAADLIGPAISYTLVANTSCTTDITFSATIIDPSGVNALPMTKPRLYFKKTGDANTFAGNTSADNGWKYVEATNAVSPFTFTTNYALLQSAVVTTDVIQYFIVAQDLATPNVGINSGVFNTAPLSVALAAGNFPLTGTINSYTIVAAGLSGAITVGAAGTYTSLTGAAGLFNAINTSGMSSSVSVQLLDASIAETGAVALNAVNYNGCAAGPYSLVIKPASGVNTTLTGSVSSGAIIKLNGADNVTFDGSNNGTSSRNLTITNTTATTSGNAVIWLAAPAAANGANNNTIKNCIIEGNTATTTFLGMYVGGNASISLTAAGLENNNNTTIENNLFRKTQYGLAFFGYAAATPDNGNMIINNNFGTAVAGEGFQLEGIHVDRQNNMVVSGNEVQNVKGTSTTVMYGIRLLDFKNGQAYKNNVHNLNYSGTSTSARLYGFAVISSTYTTAGNPSQAQIYNNLVYDITTSATSSTWNMTGMFAGAGYGDKYYFNTIHLTGQLNNSSSGMSAAFANGDGNFAGFGTNLDVRNNIFNVAGSSLGGNVWAYYSRATSLSGTTQNNNVIRCAGTGATNNTAQLNAVNYTTLAAWQAASGVDAASIESDPLMNSNTNLIPGPGSPTLAAGATGTGITTDYLGVSRGTPPTIGAYEQTGDFTVPAITYTTQTNTACTMGPTITATITDISGVNAVPGTKPRLYYKKSTDANTYAGNTNADNGWKYVEASNGASPFSLTMDYTLLQSAIVVGDIIQYFVVGQDLAVTPNVGINTGTFTINPASVALIAANFPVTGMNSFTILVPGLTGTVTIGAAGTYTSLTEAAGLFADINAKGLSGNLVAQIVDATLTENGTNMLNAMISTGCSGGPFTLTIKPTLTTTLSGSSTTAIIRLNGADNVIIDGSIGSTTNTVCPPVAASRDMTIINTNTGTSSAVVWIQTNGSDAATNNTVMNCNLTGNSNTTTLFGVGSGSSTISTTSLGTANNNNSFVNNAIMKTQYGIYSQGASAANKNSGTVINQNIINAVSPNNVSKGGIWTGYENNLTISGNTVSEISISGSPDVFGVSLGTGTTMGATALGTNEVTNATVTKNVIGNVINSGTFSAAGIAVATATSGTNLIANNMIYGVAANGTGGDFAGGIVIGGGTGSTTRVYYNTVSMQGTVTGASSATQTAACLAVTNSTEPTLDVRNNIFTVTQIGNSGASLRFASIALGYSTYALLTSNNNDLYSAGAGPGTYTIGITGGVVAGTSRSTLAAWQAETGKDGASLNFLPVFISSSNLHIDAPNAINLPLDNGAVAVSVTDDIDCETRMTDIGADEFSPPACTMATGGTAVVTGATAFCASGTPVITSSGYSVGIGSGYQWMYSTSSGDYPLAGSPVMGQTNPATLATGVVSTTTYYWLKVTCSAGMSIDYSNMLTITINPSVAAISGPSSKCANDPAITLTESGGTGTSWLWSTTETTQSISVNPASTTIYTVTVTSPGACTATSSTTVTVIPAPAAPTVTPTTPQTLCLGFGQSLTASSTGGSAVSLLSDDFNSTTPGTTTSGNLPAGWSGSSLTSGVRIWGVVASAQSGSTLGGGNFLYCESDLYTAFQTRSQVTTPVFNASGYSNVMIKFKHYYNDLSSGSATDSARVYVSNDGGANFTQVEAYDTDQGTAFSGAGAVMASIPPGVPLTNNMKVKLVYNSDAGGNDWYWAIDDFVIEGIPSPIYSWSAMPEIGAGLPIGAETPSSANTSITATPTIAGIYTYTAIATAAGCPSLPTTTASLTVDPVPTITLDASPLVCSGITMADLSYNATTENPDQYSIDYNPGAEAQGFADLTNVALTVSPIVLSVPGGAAPGTYNATLTVRNSTTGCVSSSSPFTVTISPAPNAGVVSGMTPLCVGATDTYLTSGDFGGSWTSSNPTKASVNAMSGFVTALAGGSTYIKYTVGNACGSPDADSILLIVDSIVVANNNDLGPASLRAIIDCAPSGSTITFAPGMTGQTIVLLTGEITISKNLTIIGPGANDLTLSGNNSTRVFHVLPGYTLTLQDMALKNATAATNGGAIFVEGNLNLNNVLLENNMESGVPKSLSVTSAAQVEIIGNVDFKQ